MRLCEVDDDADSDVGAADAADFDVADLQAAGVDDAVDDVVDDDKEAEGDISIIMISSNVSNSVIDTSSLMISNIKTSVISSMKSIMRHAHDRQPFVKCRVPVSRGRDFTARKQIRTRGAGSQKSRRATKPPQS